MKKSNLIIMMIMLLNFVSLNKQSFAETKKTATESKSSVITQIASKSFAGSVESISVADPAKSQIIVTNQAGKKHTFVITSTTKVFDVSGGATTLDHVKVSSKVRVKYSTKNNSEEANAIHLLA